MPRSRPAAARLWAHEVGGMSYVWAGYGVTLVTLVAYAAWLLTRGRRP
jgi:heme exporter protein D